MDENCELAKDIFLQDGVVLHAAPSAYINFLTTSGTLYLTEYSGPVVTKFIEWKSNDVTIDSDLHEQEWAVVNTIEGRPRTLSGSIGDNNKRNIKINLADVKSFKIYKKKQLLNFYDGKSDILIGFMFQHDKCSLFLSVLQSQLSTVPARRDKNLYVILDEDAESEKLNKSFAQLNLFQDEPTFVWKFLSNFHTNPLETTMEAFSKIPDMVMAHPTTRTIDSEVQELLNHGISSIDSATTTTTQDEYEVIAHVPKLPTRKDYPRDKPLVEKFWMNMQDYEGRIEDVEAIKLLIFRGGIRHSFRKEVWKYLLNYFPWESSLNERQRIVKQRSEEYFAMKLQWRSMTRLQEENFSDYRDRKSLIEKDVNRTDRMLDYYAGDNNPNLQILSDILMTYVMYNFDLGYVQGMSDLLSPILCLMENEVDAFWCFVGFMDKVSSNFDLDQTGMKEQLHQLHVLLAFAEPELTNYLDKHNSGNMFFCFRWLLVWLKREFSQEDVMRLWEVLWTGLPCLNFHLLICVAILETEKPILMGNNYGFTEILKHINELSGHLDLDLIINKAEGMYNQIVAADHLTDSVRVILGLPIPEKASHEDSPTNLNNSSEQSSSMEAVQLGADEATYEKALNSSYL